MSEQEAMYFLAGAWSAEDTDALIDDASIQVINGTVQIYVPGGVVSLLLDEWYDLATWVAIRAREDSHE